MPSDVQRISGDCCCCHAFANCGDKTRVCCIGKKGRLRPRRSFVRVASFVFRETSAQTTSQRSGVLLCVCACSEFTSSNSETPLVRSQRQQQRQQQQSQRVKTQTKKKSSTYSGLSLALVCLYDIRACSLSLSLTLSPVALSPYLRSKWRRSQLICVCMTFSLARMRQVAF